MLQFQSAEIGFLQIRTNDVGKRRYSSDQAETARFFYRGLDLSPATAHAALVAQPLFFEWQQVDIYFEPAPHTPFQAPYKLLLNRQDTGLKSTETGYSHKLFGNFSLGDAVGFTDIEIRDSRNRQVFILETEVFPAKLSYKAEFEAMIEEIHSIVHHLAFDHLKKTFAFTTPTEKRQKNLPEWMAMLEILFQGIENGLDMILRTPHTWVQTAILVQPAHQIKNITLKDAGKWLGKHPQYLTREKKKGLPVVPALFTTHLPENRKTISTDTPENRFVVWAVRKIIQALEELVERQKRPHRETKKIQAEVERIRYYQQRLKARLNHPALANVTVTDQTTPHSLVLTMAPGYRDFYQKYLLLQKGLSISNDDIFRLDYKEISTLYEYWCFLKMVQILREYLRYEVRTQDLIQVNHTGLSLTLKKGKTSKVNLTKNDTGEKITLWFNRAFSEAETHTFAQIPDHILEFEKTGYQQPFRFILDAKYRLDLSGEIPGPPPDSIAQLHRYRDAILSQKQFSLTGTTAHKSLGGVILFPFPGNEEDFRRHRFFRSRKEVNIGAIPLIPGKSQTHKLFREFLHELFETPPEVLYEQVIEYERSDHQRVVTDAQTKVLIGLLPDDKYYEERRHFFIENGFFHNVWRGQAEDVDYIAFYDQRLKKIIAYGHVENRIIVWAEELEKTGVSWPRRYPGRKYIVYRLNEMVNSNLPFRGLRALGISYTSFWGLKQAIATGDDQYLYLNSYAWLRLWQEVRQIDDQAVISFFRDGKEKRQVEVRFSKQGKSYVCTLNGDETLTLKGEAIGQKSAKLRAGVLLQMIDNQSQ